MPKKPQIGNPISVLKNLSKRELLAHINHLEQRLIKKDRIIDIQEEQKDSLKIRIRTLQDKLKEILSGN